MNRKSCSAQFIVMMGLALCIVFFGVSSFSCRKKDTETRVGDKKNSEPSGISVPDRAGKKENEVDKLDSNRKNLQSRMNEKKELKNKKLAAIKEIDNTQDLQPFVLDLDFEIRSAVVTRLGEIGTEEAVKMLDEVFRKEPRKRGTDVSAGIKGEVVKALARSGHKNAKEILFEIITNSIEEGPLVKGSYSHIYDSQYYAVLMQAIGALVAFPGPDTLSFLRSVADNSKLLYSLREEAWETLFAVEMKQKGLEASKEQVRFLLARMNSKGVFPEEWWHKPGKKTDAAIKQTVIEKLIEEKGWDSVDSLLEHADSMDPEDYSQKTSAYRMLSAILIRDLAKAGDRDDMDDQYIDVIGRILNFLENIRKKEFYSSAVTDIYKSVYKAAENLQNENVWDRIKKTHKKFEASYAWKEREPSEIELGISLPPASMFIKSMSSQVEFKSGKIQRIFYFSDKPAGELVRHFETSLGIKAVEKTLMLNNGQTGTAYLIEFGNTPKEIEGFLKFGVIVFETEREFEEKAFGEVFKRGKSMFKITRFVH